MAYRAKASEEVGSASQDRQASSGGRDATQSLTPCVSASDGKAISVEWKCTCGLRSNGSLIVARSLIDRSRRAGLCSEIGWLAQELAVEEVDEDFLYARFRKAVGAVHGDELAADALKLRERHGRGGKLEWALDIGDADLAAAFPWMVFLVGRDLGDDVGGSLVELVEVVLLGGRFLRLSGASDTKGSQVRTSTVAW